MVPNFLIIGAEKSGTTWLYDRLRRHPDIFMPEVKEIHFFNRKDSNLQLRRNYEKHDAEWYRDHFRRRNGERAVGEATPMYLCDEAAPGRIRNHLSDVKLIACLRYPTDRAYSHYWMARGKDHTYLDFEQIVRNRDDRFVSRGSYGRQLDRYLSLFDRDQLYILIYEELFSNTSKYLNKVCSFLGVSNTFYQGQSWITETVNRSSTVRSTILHRAIGHTAKWMRGHEGFRQLLDIFKGAGIADCVKQVNKESRDYPRMPSEIRKKLDRYYAPTVLHVEQFLGCRITRWRDRSTLTLPETSLEQ